jgi:hypothetical protein
MRVLAFFLVAVIGVLPFLKTRDLHAALTDYMSLLKVDGEWKIVNKLFNAEPKGKPTTNLKAAQLPDDRDGVKQAVLDYVEALYEADSARIGKECSPRLV